ncbi:hypothetical protein K504DRAFT_144241 [Pleomassaria siparia CBS 279.74]|uniref:Uncharacterized protein n=1 Tax=Pleomassaria siparia CBS 279.74 TaxID=1314801 RepID=A0A6G1KMR0_9PLEO|nr:hypothetical protein K504DRAFT_144241 [Pleomassaria siparia CBS 279.74]
MWTSNHDWTTPSTTNRLAKVRQRVESTHNRLPNAGTPSSLEKKMALCSSCQNISIPALTRQLDIIPDWWKEFNSQSKPSGMVHLRDARQLPFSAAGGCSLCAMIRDAIMQYNTNGSRFAELGARCAWDIAQFEQHLIDSPIYLRPNYEPPHKQPAFPEVQVAKNAYHVRGFNVFVPVNHGILAGQIRLFALKDDRKFSCSQRRRYRSSSPTSFGLPGCL